MEAWLSEHLSNSWMASGAFTAQAAHVCFACAVILAARLYALRLPRVVVPCVALAALKEFWFDAHYEIPRQTLPGSTLDFSMYLAGMALGVLLALLAPVPRLRLHPSRKERLMEAFIQLMDRLKREGE